MSVKPDAYTRHYLKGARLTFLCLMSQELLAYIPQVAGLKAGLNAKMTGGGTGGAEDEAAITDFKAKVT